MLLKADFHIHTREDPHDFIRYTAVELIAGGRPPGLRRDRHHLPQQAHPHRGAAPARRRPGHPAHPGRGGRDRGPPHAAARHALHAGCECAASSTCARCKRDGGLVIAPHPFFPAPKCLNAKLRENLDLFDAIEFSHFYTRTVDFNRKAVEYARQMGCPLVGTSDCHRMWQLGTTYTLVDAEREDGSGRVRGHPRRARPRGHGAAASRSCVAASKWAWGGQRGHPGDATTRHGSAGAVTTTEIQPKRALAAAGGLSSGGRLVLRHEPLHRIDVMTAKRNPTRAVRVGSRLDRRRPPRRRAEHVRHAHPGHRRHRRAGRGDPQGRRRLVRVAVDNPKDVGGAGRDPAPDHAPTSWSTSRRTTGWPRPVAPHVDKIRYNPGHLYHHEREKPVRGEGALPGRRGARARLRDPGGRQLRQRRPRDQGRATPRTTSRPWSSRRSQHCAILDDLGFDRYVVSLKDSHPRKVIEANLRFAAAAPRRAAAPRA